MAKSNCTPKTARRFDTVDLGNGKTYTPIRDEFGDMEYELMYHGRLIGYAYEIRFARERLNEYAYDAERNRVEEVEAVEDTALTAADAADLAPVVAALHDELEAPALVLNARQQELIKRCLNAAEPLPFEPRRRLRDEPLPPEAISTLVDGSTVYGRFDTDDTHCVAYVDTPDDWYVSAGDEQCAGVYHRAYGISIEELTPEGFQSLKRLVNSGAIEHLFACGLAWDTNQAVPAAQAAPVPLVTVSREQYDYDESEGMYSDVATCGTAALYIHHDPAATPNIPWDFSLNGHYLQQADDIRALYDAVALLNSNTARAMLAGAGIDLRLPLVAPVAPTPAVRLQRHICDDQIDEKCGQGIGTEFAAGGGDGAPDEAMVYFSDRPHWFNRPLVYTALTGDELPLADAPAFLTKLTTVADSLRAVLSDPRVQRAQRRVEAGVSAIPVRLMDELEVAA